MDILSPPYPIHLWYITIIPLKYANCKIICEKAHIKCKKSDFSFDFAKVNENALFIFP